MQREIVEQLIDKSYEWCRNYHYRTDWLLATIMENVSDNTELCKWLQVCLDDGSDPRYNIFFRNREEDYNTSYRTELPGFIPNGVASEGLVTFVKNFEKLLEYEEFINNAFVNAPPNPM